MQVTLFFTLVTLLVISTHQITIEQLPDNDKESIITVETVTIPEEKPTQ